MNGSSSQKRRSPLRLAWAVTLRLAPVGAGALLRLWGGRAWGLPLLLCLGVLSAAVFWMVVGGTRRESWLWLLVCSLALMAAGYLLPGRRLFYGAAAVLHAAWRGQRIAVRTKRNLSGFILCDAALENTVSEKEDAKRQKIFAKSVDKTMQSPYNKQRRRKRRE